MLRSIIQSTAPVRPTALPGWLCLHCAEDADARDAADLEAISRILDEERIA